MDIHEIRLRGGWECDAPDKAASGPNRLTLPVRVDSLPDGRLRLTRRFNRPPRVDSGPVVLRLLQSPGTQSVLLNGRSVGPISPDCPDMELELGTLSPRNELVIEAEPRGRAPVWGVISLIFR